MRISIFVFTTLFIMSCQTVDPTLTLNLPNETLDVVQQIPSSEIGRDKNTLYLAPRKITQDEFNSPKLQLLVDSMYNVMHRTAGVGIAANQIGKRLQVFIIEAKPNNPRYKVLGEVPKQIFINPKITKVSSSKKNFWHGCLSAKNQNRGNVAAYEWLEYQCQDIHGNIQSGKLEGFSAVIFQHEFKHLMTGTYLDVAHQFLSKPELDHEIEIGKTPFFDYAPDTLPLLIQGYTIGESLEEYHAKKQSSK
jgi:peptide deformylase